MPRPAKRHDHAIFNLIYRCAVSGKLKAEFQDDNFDVNFSKYHAYGAMLDRHHAAAEKILKCETCNTGLDHIHGHLHEHGIVPHTRGGKSAAATADKGCSRNGAYNKPHLFYAMLVVSGLLLAFSAERLAAAAGMGALIPEAQWAAVGLPVLGLLAGGFLVYVARLEGV